MNESDTTEPNSAEADSTSTESEISLSTVVDKAMELLARREHSRVELREKLGRRSYPADLVDSVLDDFAERNLQSDERFAEVYVRSRLVRGYGELKIRSELQSRGIAGSLVQLALEASGADWYRNAELALEKKFASRLTPGLQSRSDNISGKPDYRPGRRQCGRERWCKPGARCTVKHLVLRSSRPELPALPQLFDCEHAYYLRNKKPISQVL